MNQETFDNFTDMLKEAEDTFRKGSASLSEWSAQARDILQNKPGVLLAAVAVSGFMTGALIRQGFSKRGQQQLRREFPADPIITFIAGAAAGILLGQRILNEAIETYGMGSHSADAEGETIPGIRTGLTAVPQQVRDERPFEKSFPG